MIVEGTSSSDAGKNTGKPQGSRPVSVEYPPKSGRKWSLITASPDTDIKIQTMMTGILQRTYEAGGEKAFEQATTIRATPIQENHTVTQIKIKTLGGESPISTTIEKTEETKAVFEGLAGFFKAVNPAANAPGGMEVKQEVASVPPMPAAAAPIASEKTVPPVEKKKKKTKEEVLDEAATGLAGKLREINQGKDKTKQAGFQKALKGEVKKLLKNPIFKGVKEDKIQDLILDHLRKGNRDLETFLVKWDLLPKKRN